MSASTFLFDLSGAIPWFLAGVLTTLLIWWLRRLFGQHPYRHDDFAVPAPPPVQNALLTDLEKRHADEVASLREELGAARTTAVRYADERSKIETELVRQRQAAGAITQLETDLDTARRAEISRREEVANANSQILALRNQLQSQQQASPANSATLAAEIARLRTETQESARALTAKSEDAARLHAQINSMNAAASSSGAEIGALKTENSRLQSQISAMNAATSSNGSEIGTFKNEIARLQAQVDAQARDITNKAGLIATIEGEVAKARAQSAVTADATALSAIRAERDQLTADMGEARKAYESLRDQLRAAEKALYAVGPEIEDLRHFKATSGAEMARLSSHIASLNADLENFRRFKEALETANRIAASRPS